MRLSDSQKFWISHVRQPYKVYCHEQFISQLCYT